jgi:hypothetical protein
MKPLEVHRRSGEGPEVSKPIEAGNSGIELILKQPRAGEAFSSLSHNFPKAQISTPGPDDGTYS